MEKPTKKQKTDMPIDQGPNLTRSPPARVESPNNNVIAISGNTFNHFGDNGLSMEPPSMGPQQQVLPWCEEKVAFDKIVSTAGNNLMWAHSGSPVWPGPHGLNSTP